MAFLFEPFVHSIANQRYKSGSPIYTTQLRQRIHSLKKASSLRAFSLWVVLKAVEERFQEFAQINGGYKEDVCQQAVYLSSQV